MTIILNPGLSAGCDDDCEGERGERGKRGHRGHRGHDGQDGATGATGPTGSAGLGTGGLLKFSGFAPAVLEGGTISSFLADGGIGLGSNYTLVPQNYPVAIERTVRNLAVNIGSFVVPGPTGEIIVELLKNGVAVYSILFEPGDTGVQSLIGPPISYAIEDLFDLRVTTTDLAVIGVDVTATIGVE